MSDDKYPSSIDSLFEAALELDSSVAREAFLDEACCGNPTLRNQIEDLLRADREAGSFLDPPDSATAASVSGSVLALLKERINNIPSVVLRNVDEEPILNPSSSEVPQDQNTTRYQLMGEIARGGMGAIIRGHDTDLGRDLALKVLLDEHKKNPDCVRRFVEEAQISGQLQHPGITPVFELGRFPDKRPYFSMKLVKGQTLAAILEAREPMDADHGRLLGVFAQICQTMAYAHSRGVIHRDLKPANVMVGKFGEVQVMDWGLAKVLGEGGTIDEQKSRDKQTDRRVIQTLRETVGKTETRTGSDTRLGSVMGTFPYMPPEQALGEVDRLDERVDVFALGAILSEILTGMPAYVAEVRTDFQRMATGGELDDCLSRLDNCQAEPELVSLAKGCLAREPQERIRNAGVVAEKFAKLQDSLEERLKLAELEKLASETRANEERRRRKIYVGICFLLACVGAAALYAAGSIRSLYLDKAQLVVQKEEQRQRADQAAHVAKVRWLATESRALQAEKPEASVLLALEACHLSQQDRAMLMPIAHESLLNSTQSLGGKPLRIHSEVTVMQMTERRLVTLADERVRIFDLLANDPDQSLTELGSENNSIRQIATSQDGRWLLTLGNKLERWDLENLSRGPQAIPKDPVIVTAALSSDGRWMVTQDERGVIRRWDSDMLALGSSRTLDEDSQLWDRILVTHDGSWVVLQQSQSACRLLDIGEATVERIDIETRSGVIFTTEVSRNGKWLAVGDRDGVRLFDLHAATVEQSVVALPTSAYPTTIQGLRFSQSSRWLFGWHPGFSWITRWNLEGINELPLIIDGDDSGVRSLALTDDGQSLTFGSGTGTVERLELSSDQSLQKRSAFKVHDWPVENIAMHPQGRWMATADWDGFVRLWDMDAASPMSSPFTLGGQNDQPYTPVAISSNGRWIATGLKGYGVELRDTQHPRDIPKILQGHTERLRKFVFGHDDRWLITHSTIPSNGNARIWDLSKPNPADDVRELSGISAVVAAKNYQKLAAVYKDDTVRLIDLAGDDPAGSAQIIGTHEVDSLIGLAEMAISPDARWLVTKCQTTSPTTKVRIYVWDLKAKDIAESCQKLDGKKQFTYGNGLAIDATSRWLVSGGRGEGNNSHEDTVTAWDLHATDIETSARTIKKNGGIWQVAVSPKCQWIFTAGGKEVQLWDLRNDRLVPHPLLHCGQSAAISRDGRWLAASGRVQFNTLLFDLEADEPWNSARVLRGHNAPIWSLAFSDDSRWLVTDSSDGTVRRWCMDTDWLLRYANESVGRQLTKQERSYYGLESPDGAEDDLGNVADEVVPLGSQ